MTATSASRHPHGGRRRWGRRHAFEREHPALVGLGRFGWFAKGVVYVLAGSLAVLVALHTGAPQVAVPAPAEASPTGAIVGLSSVPGGRLVLALFTVGLAVYALWRVGTAVLPGDRDLRAMATRIGYVLSAVFYGALSLTALALVRHPGQRRKINGNVTVRDLTKRALVLPVGRIAVWVAGAVLIAAAVFRCRQALVDDPTEDIELRGASGTQRRWLRRSAAIGELGRCAAIALIGVFLIDASLAARADRATGLDGALVRVARFRWGPAAVGAVGAAFVVYGLLCMITFTRRRLTGPSTKEASA